VLLKNIISSIIGSFFILIACSCSSAPKTADIDQRAQYTQAVEQTLANYEQKDGRAVKGSRATELRAMVSDTRTELNRLDAATERDWLNHKPRVEERLARLQTNFGQAK